MPLITVREACTLTGKPHWTILRWINTSRVKAEKVEKGNKYGYVWMVDQESVFEFAQGCKHKKFIIPDGFISMGDLSSRTGISKPYLYILAKLGKIPVQKTNNAVMVVDAKHVDDLVVRFKKCRRHRRPRGKPIDDGQVPFNTELRSRRIQSGLSQVDLAAKTGFAPAVISQIERIEKANPRSEAVKKLSSFFGVAPEVLCPKWLSVIKRNPKPSPSRSQDTIVEQSLYSVRKEVLAIEAPDSALVSSEIAGVEWIKEVTPIILSDVEKRVISLFLGFDESLQMTYEDIANRVEIPVGTVKSCIFRSKDKLAAEWKSHEAGMCVTCPKLTVGK